MKRAHPLPLVIALLGCGCAADFESEPVVMCTGDRGCPIGSRCTVDGLCESTSGEAGGPSTPTPTVLIDMGNGGFPPQLLDGGSDIIDANVSREQETCGAGTSACDNDCIDLTTNRDHCGTCGFACPPGTECVLGACLEELPGTLPNPGT